ncbi:sodium-independent anion transporter [Longibacter salinarum]|uniref:Sodium-independent anion transporter n=1 Tax=Longibacter salinarum TaxID=1850348 RepID=A0A2A8D322_9BACT|nr:solute carrier family 26 protein [Longibacter salinarum]PEN15281.1 sodium-independent anion transporter [Longibacter salinarum]
MPRLASLFPIADQLSSYSRDALRGDLSAGLTVGVMLIPQGMAYALIAGMPPIYGLYASLVPLVVYALFGTSRQLAVGPVAMVSLLVAAAVGPLANGDVNAYIGFALLLSLMVGVLQFGLGITRFGFLVNFLSHPVLSGFTSAAALIIGLSQLKHLLGVDIERSHYIHEILIAAGQQIGDVHVITLVIGVGSILLLVALRRWLPMIPGALAAVALSTGAVWAFGLADAGVNIVASVPSGLPSPSLPPLDFAAAESLIPSALAIGLVGFMESIAVAKVYASRHRYEVDANRELVGLGLANIAGAFFSAYPTTGGFSRTAVNDQAGAKTNLAAIVSAAIIALTLLFLTPLFYYLPKAVLAAIVMVAVFGLIDWEEAAFLWRVDRKDFALMILTFFATLSLGIEAGILAGVIVSLIVVIYQSSKPHTAMMGRLPGTETYRNLKRNPNALTDSSVVIVRMDAGLYFANVNAFKDLVAKIGVEDEALEALVIDMYPVNTLDSTGVHTLGEVVGMLRRQDVDVYFSGVKGPVMDVLKRAGLANTIGHEYFFHEVHQAVEAAEEKSSTSFGELNTSSREPAEA